MTIDLSSNCIKEGEKYQRKVNGPEITGTNRDRPIGPSYKYSPRVVENDKEDTNAQAESIGKVKIREKARAKEAQKDSKCGGYDGAQYSKIKSASNELFSKLHLTSFYQRESLLPDKIAIQRSLVEYHGNKTIKELERECNGHLREKDLEGKIYEDEDNIIIVEIKPSMN